MENANKDIMETNPRKLRSCCFMWLIVCISVLIVCAILSKAEEKVERDDSMLRIYSVLVEGEPLAFRASTNINSKAMAYEAKKMEAIHEEILGSTLENGSYTKLYSFKHVINAFAVRTTSYQAKKLTKAKGVKAVEEDKGVKLMTTYTPDFLELPQQVWPKISNDGDRRAGEDIVIGLVDTGINPTHPSFAGLDLTNPYSSNLSRLNFSGDCETGPLFPAGSCNGKLISARFFSAGARASGALNSSLDILSPFDASGHGSHVASIAAGNAGVPVIVDGFFYGRASGMAPRARIAVYKAIYPSIGTLVDVIAAIDQAIMDGVDVLTLSIGPDQPPVDKPTVLGIFDLAMLLARKAGVFVVQAAGNHGPSPSSVLSYSPWVVGVAAGNTDRSYPASLILDGGQTVQGVGLSGPTLGAPFLQHKLVLARDAVRTNGSVLQTLTRDIEECQRPEYFDPAVVLGSIVICTFSDGFYNQMSTVRAITQTARTLGFMGFILIAHPRYGDYVAEPVIFSAPGILIPKVSDAQIILRYYEEKTFRDKRGLVTQFGARARIGDGRNSVFAGTAPAVSRFSSRGPAFIDANRNLLDVLKPDILAPGHQIWGAWSLPSAFDPILTGRSFAILSGTSMAAPHIAGIGAMIKQLNPSWTPAMIASAISTTATEYDSSGEVISAESYEINGLFPSNHFDHGAGHVNPARAIDPGLVLPAGFEDYISFLCSLPNINPVTIRAATGVWCTTPLSHQANLNHPSVTISALKESLVVKRSFQNVSNKTETYLGSILPPNGTAVRLIPSWFTVPPQRIQGLDIEFNVTQVLNQFTFGEVVLTGSLNHIIRIPLSVKTI
ncbi:PREDICTED: subtilisin-like protease SBT2.4 [Camelina sativa]|uniref:Subtilisin-like protease SBT2.4 n=1 Tax=Camelina sativa TaxID=90675 RepID=A0ABM0WMZ7_CAMSA|nr:PREDICTED: subtilisin-like protease SBT2.4 [Camelina sativa]